MEVGASRVGEVERWQHSGLAAACRLGECPVGWIFLDLGPRHVRLALRDEDPYLDSARPWIMAARCSLLMSPCRALTDLQIAPYTPVANPL